MTIITIFTDASHCSDTLAGGWAMWAKRASDEKIVYGNSFKNPIKDNNTAEILAVANAMIVIEKHNWFSQNDRVVIGIDSDFAIKVFQNKNFLIDKSIKDAYIYVMNLKKKYNLNISFRHVKGHVSLAKRNNRNHVNNTVDKIAREKMREMRIKLRGF